MQRFAMVLGPLVFLIIAACGGGDDSTTTATPDAAGTAIGSGQVSSGGGGGGAGSDSKFCAADSNDALNRLDFSLDASSLKDRLDGLGDALNQWADSAPGDYQDDAKLVASTVTGMMELLAENDFNFVAMGTTAADDPRMIALDDPEFEAAEARISAYCGWDSVSVGGGSAPAAGGSGSGGSTGGGLSVDLPAGFPEDLIAPGSTTDFVGSFSGASTVQLSSTDEISQVIEYYKSTLGEPTIQSPDGTVWLVSTDNQTRTVTVGGTDGAVQIIIVIEGA